MDLAGAAAINWPSLCSGGQSLTDANGCLPDCTNGSAAPACAAIFNAGQVSQSTGVPTPVLSNGVVVFKLTQTGGGSSASFNVFLASTPTGFGYMCEVLNSNATRATVWDASQNPAISTSVIAMDASTNPGLPITSDNFVSTVTQPAVGGPVFWYTNPSNPLYTVCLSYQLTGNQLGSHAACGGAGNACISYSIQ